MGFTSPLTLNGTSNLLSLLRTAGYQGPARLIHDGSLIQNMDAALDFWLHFTDSNLNAPGVRQVETCVVVGTISTAGNATFTLTASGMTGSPIALSVAVTLGMTASQVAVEAAKALIANSVIDAFFEVGVIGPNIILTKRVTAANDATLNLAFADDTSVGLSDDASSNNTTAGALNTTNGIPVGVDTGLSVGWGLPQGTDLSTTWLHSASSITVNAAIQG